jgi:atypical dual specificity phosphatase
VTSEERVSDTIVRPLGYVEDGPVVRQVGDRDLFLGNGVAAEAGRHDHSFAAVVSVSTEPRALTTHHRPLDDGPGNDWAAFAAAVDTARGLHRRDGSLLVNCTAGVSRSSAVVATTLAAEEGRDLHDALALVQRVRPVATPHPALHEQAVVFLAARS